ncbi:hypothetical protein ACRJ4W_40840 [Streptomyces sp. GLT-R25]
MRPDSVRRALRLGACAGAMAGLLTVGLALPAAAADDEPETDQLWINSPYEQSLPLGTDGGEPPARTLDLGLYHDNSNFTVTDGKLTVDVSGLAGVAEVTWPDACTPSGTTAVCVVPDVPVVGEGDKQADPSGGPGGRRRRGRCAGADHVRGDRDRRSGRRPRGAAGQFRHDAHGGVGSRPLDP